MISNSTVGEMGVGGAATTDIGSLLQGRRLLVASGDPATDAVERERSSGRSDVVVLAVDSPTLTWALRAGIPSLSPPDLLSDERLERLADVAESAVDEFLADLAARTSESRIAPAISPMMALDRPLLAEWVAAALQVQEGLAALDEVGVRWTNHVFAVLWDATDHERTTAREFGTFGTPRYLARVSRSRASRHWAPRERRMRDRIRDYAVLARGAVGTLVQRLREASKHRGARGASDARNLPPGSIVGVMLALEFDRHADDLAGLAAAGHPPVLIPFERNYVGRYAKADKLIARTGHRVLIRRPARKGSLLRHRLAFASQLRSWRRTRSGSHGPDVQAAEEALAAIAPALASRWGSMAADWECWYRLWCSTSPGAVVTVRSTASALVPLLAAAAAEVRTVSLPHGMAETRLTAAADPFVRHLTPFRRVEASRLSGWVSSNGAVLGREYRRAVTLFATEEASCPRVVILVDQSGALVSGVDRTARLAHRLISHVEQRPGVEFIVKDHPSGPLFSRLVGPTLPANVTVAAPDVDLHALLATAQAVLLFDYDGSAALHATMSDLPVVRLELDGRTASRQRRMDPAWNSVLDALPRMTDLDRLDPLLDVVESAGAGGDLLEWSVRDRSGVAVGGPTLHELLRNDWAEDGAG